MAALPPIPKGTAVVRTSKYRHLFGTAGQTHDNVLSLKLGSVQVESNVLRANGSVFAIPWNISGTMAVIPLSFRGAVNPGEQPLIVHDEKTVNDFNFNPFHDNILATACSDGSVNIWDVPLTGLTQNLTTPAQTIQASDKRLLNVSFHPLAENVLVTIDAGKLVRFHDLESGSEKLALPDVHKQLLTNVSWNGDGSLLATSCKDKNLRVFDPRANSVVGEVTTHQGAKGAHCLWLTGKKDWILTVGFGKTSEREYCIWDPRNLGGNPLAKAVIDNTSSSLMPFYDVDNGIIWLAGKGDGNIRFYEVVDDAPYIHYLSEFKSKDPQSGVAALPKSKVDVMKCEIMRFLKITPQGVVTPIRWEVPRADNHFFQEDLFPDTFDGKPSMQAPDWFGGANVPGGVVSLNPEKK